MQITIDTNNLTSADRRVLEALAGTVPSATNRPTSEPSAPAPERPAEARQFTAADFEAVPGVGEVVAQRIVEHLYGAETAENETPEPSAPEEAPAPETDAEDAPTMSDAVAVATQLVSSGKAAQVKAALAEVGAKRVSEMDEGDIPAFLAALAQA